MMLKSSAILICLLLCGSTTLQDVGELANRLADDDPSVRDSAEAQLLSGDQQTLDALMKILESGSIQNSVHWSKLKAVIDGLRERLEIAKAIPPLKKASFKFSNEPLHNALAVVAKEFGLSFDVMPQDGVVDGEASGNVFQVLDSIFAKSKYSYYLGAGNQVKVFTSDSKPPCVDTKFGRIYARNVHNIFATDLAESEHFVVTDFEHIYPQPLDSVLSTSIDIAECRNKDEVVKEYEYDRHAGNRKHMKLIDEIERSFEWKIFKVPSDCTELDYYCTLTITIKGDKQFVELTKSDAESEGYEFAGYRLRFGKISGRVSIEIEQTDTAKVKDLIDTDGVVATLKSGDTERLRISSTYDWFWHKRGAERSRGIRYTIAIDDSKYDEIQSIKVPVQNIRTVKEPFNIKIPLK